MTAEGLRGVNADVMYWIPFVDPPLILERYREYQHGSCARMTRAHREVSTILNADVMYSGDGVAPDADTGAAE